MNLSAGVRVCGKVHIQNVNGWHSRYLAHSSRRQRVLDAGRLSVPAQWLRPVVQYGKGRNASLN